jgi:putative transposase
MPDHVHFFAADSPNAKGRAVWLKMLKSVSARELCVLHGVKAPLWQTDSFDHILRSSESYSEKWHYVRMNPVRATLVKNPDDWRWQGEINPLQF